MFSLLFGLWRLVFSKAEFHVLVLGVDKAGKTVRPAAAGLPLRHTLLERVKSIYGDGDGLPPERIVPTVGLNIGRVEAHKAKLIFWDLGGQLGLRAIWEKYYEEAHAVVYVVDAAAHGQLEDAKNALEKILRHEDLLGAPVLIFANKQDIDGAMSADELTRYLDLRQLRNRDHLVTSACSYDGSGIRDGVLWLVEAMRKSQRSLLLKQQAEGAAII
eukprot:SM000015S01263  [mRNA]  locus=s15:887643:889427:+ [translate_table: standard]